MLRQLIDMLDAAFEALSGGRRGPTEDYVPIPIRVDDRSGRAHRR